MFRLLFSEGRTLIQIEEDPLQIAPQSMKAYIKMIAGLRRAGERLSELSVDTIIGLCDATARNWVADEQATVELIRQFDLGYVTLSMRGDHLRRWCDFSLRGKRESLDRFVNLNDDPAKSYRAQPRGIVAHWIAGNVPVLGMLSLLQGLLTKNANIIKAPRRFAGILPHLLESMAQTNWTDEDGSTYSGKMLTDAVSVVYFERDDQEAARQLSLDADIRVAWGGREAVEAIMNLPRRFGTEDIVFGPKLSFAVIGKEMIGQDDDAADIAAAIVRDAGAFDQLGCNSPHTVFVESGGNISPSGFALHLAEAFRRTTQNRPIFEVDPVAAFNVVTLRAEYAIRGEVHHGEGVEWTVVYDENDVGLADPAYLRTLFVREINNIFEIAKYCSLNTQTAGLAVGDRRTALAEVLTKNGVERCPAVGNMMIYDTPWDGMIPMERMVRWTSMRS